MKPRYLLLTSSLALALASCTTISARPGIVAVLGDTPTVTGGTFSTGGGVTVAADIRERNGRILLCGVWAQSHQQAILTKGRAREVVTRGSVLLGKVALAREIAFMREVAPAANYAGSEASCRMTDQPWSGAAAANRLTVRIPNHLVHREIDDSGGGGQFVYFRSGGPGAGGS